MLLFKIIKEVFADKFKIIDNRESDLKSICSWNYVKITSRLEF